VVRAATVRFPAPLSLTALGPKPELRPERHPESPPYGYGAASCTSFAATRALLTLNVEVDRVWSMPLRRTEPLLADALAHLRALQARFHDESMNYAIEI